MTILEHLTDKLQAVLGRQYKVYPGGAFQRDFFKPVETPLGREYTVFHQAFDELSRTIPVVLTLAENNLTVVPFRLFNGTYMLQFWVPIDVNTPNKKAPAFRFHADMERLRAALANTELSFGEDLRGFLTVSEEVFSGQIENTGAYKRAVFNIAGNLSIAEKSVGVGGDVQIAFVVGDRELPVQAATNLNINYTIEPMAVQQDGELMPRQNATLQVHGVTFNVSDFAGDPAAAFFEDCVFANKTNNNVAVRIYKNNVLRSEFKAVLSITYVAAGKAGYGTYAVGLTNTGNER